MIHEEHLACKKKQTAEVLSDTPHKHAELWSREVKKHKQLQEKEWDVRKQREVTSKKEGNKDREKEKEK
jgi:hypothetical protein